MTTWRGKGRRSEDRRHRQGQDRRRSRLCALCGRHRAAVGDACQPCWDALLVERRQVRQEARQARRAVGMEDTDL